MLFLVFDNQLLEFIEGSFRWVEGRLVEWGRRLFAI